MDGNGSNVKLVRCPKCENLLPELPDFSLYKCGGCGAVLRAIKQGARCDDLLEKSGEDKGLRVFEKEKQICEKSNSSINSSSSKAQQDKVPFKATDQNNRVETMDLYHRQGNLIGDKAYFGNRYNPYSRGQFDNHVHKDGDLESPKSKFSTFSGPLEGSSNYRFNFAHDVGKHKRVEILENDRAELLRKIDELKIQLESSSDLREKPRDIGPLNTTMNSHSYVPEGPFRANLQYQDYNQVHALNDENIYPPNRVLRSSYQQPYDQFMGHNLGVNQNNFAHQICIGPLNEPRCSCFQCYRNWQVQSRVPQATLIGTRHHLSSGSYGFHRHNPVRLSDSNDGLMRRAVVPHGAKRSCHPRLGGAPFFACPNCFVLLKFPKNLTKDSKNSKKIQCGACSMLILVKIKNNGIVISIPSKHGEVSIKGDVISYGEAHIEDVKTLDYFLKADDFENSTTNLPSTIEETNALSGQSSERQGPVSSSSSFSEDEQSPDSVIVVKETSNSADLVLKDDSPLQEYSKSAQNLEPDDDYSDFIYSKCGMGNKSKRASRQNSVKDVQMVTEKEVICSDMAVTEVASERQNKQRIDEESESFFGGFFKKSFKKLLRPSDSMEMSRINVFVNGHPLSNRVVKKAEKLAGPIQPGNYWYDYRAGFWGVMGQPCHGIIPPFIEEFSFAMPRKCAAGNTGVFVNGRELHETDLELLASRGLPTTRDKFYMIDISGRVVDEYTGQEMDDLGKLAPTVEKVKHGFGMRQKAVVE